MSEQSIIIIMILGMAVVTAFSRVLPMLCLRSDKMPPALLDWLSFVPVSVLAALLGPELLLKEGRFIPFSENIYLWAALPALLAAYYTKSFFGSILLGMGCVAAARYLGM